MKMTGELGFIRGLDPKEALGIGFRPLIFAGIELEAQNQYNSDEYRTLYPVFLIRRDADPEILWACNFEKYEHPLISSSTKVDLVRMELAFETPFDLDPPYKKHYLIERYNQKRWEASGFTIDDLSIVDFDGVIRPTRVRIKSRIGD